MLLAAERYAGKVALHVERFTACGLRPLVNEVQNSQLSWCPAPLHPLCEVRAPLGGVFCHSTQSPTFLVDQSLQTNSELLGRKWCAQVGRAWPAAGRVYLLGWDGDTPKGVPGTCPPRQPLAHHWVIWLDPHHSRVKGMSTRAFPRPVALADLKDSSALRTDRLLVLSAVGSSLGLTSWR